MIGIAEEEDDDDDCSPLTSTGLICSSSEYESLLLSRSHINDKSLSIR